MTSEEMNAKFDRHAYGSGDAKHESDDEIRDLIESGKHHRKVVPTTDSKPRRDRSHIKRGPQARQ
ncbi:MAG TPA: hypothetical protein VIN59_06130 [Alphaproteobacteria bacterium]